jgi:hypothetical protein
MTNQNKNKNMYVLETRSRYNMQSKGKAIPVTGHEGP